MNLKTTLAGAAMALCALAGASAQASVIYTYTGSPFTGFTSCAGCTKLTGSITLAAPLGDNLTLATVTPLTFSFTDGVQTVNETNELSGYTTFSFNTDSNGAIIAWANNYVSVGFETNISSNSSVGDITTHAFDAAFTETAGRWSVAGVPEPATWTLTLVGFGGLGAMMRRRRAALAA